MRQKFLAGKRRSLRQVQSLSMFAAFMRLEILARVDRTTFHMPTLPAK